MGTVSVTIGDIIPAGSKLMASGTITMSSSYATSGDTFTSKALGLTTLDRLMLGQAKGYILEVDRTNVKVLAYRWRGFTPAGTNAAPAFTGTAHAHDLVFNANAAANAVTMAANSLRNATAGALTVVGGGADGGIANTTAAGTIAAPAFTGTAVAANTLVEVAAAVDLSAVVVDYVAYGY